MGLQVLTRYWVWSPLNADVLEILQEFEILQRFALPASLYGLALNRNKAGASIFILK